MGEFERLDERMMAIAGRCALRGVGAVEPNPTVGCVIGTTDGRLLSAGHHMRFGGPHAEVVAIQRANELGHETRGTCAWVTLEPCAHDGKTPPCTEALLDAGIGRVVIARRDSHAEARGGAEVLREAGVEVVERDTPDLAWWSSAPFSRRVSRGLPWVVAKWAQSIDGRIATSSGESKWISGPGSRRRVHRVRGMADTIVTGIGTVEADDPTLNVRDARARRTPCRAVIDPQLRIPLDSRLVSSAGEIPLIVYTDATVMDGPSVGVRDALREAGAEVVGMNPRERGIRIESVLRHLVETRDATNVLLEAGPGLLGRAFEESLVSEALVFIAPKLMGDNEAIRPVGGGPLAKLSDATALRLWRNVRVGGDVMLRYVVEGPGSSS